MGEKSSFGRKYHKIQTIFKRDQKGKIIEGDYSLPEIEFLKDNLWEFQEKVDGTNIRIAWNGNIITIGGKTDNAQIPTFLFAKLTEIFQDKKEIFKEIFGDSETCLYGEGYGAKIQKGGGNYKSDGVDFVLFDIRIGNTFLRRESVEEIQEQLKLDIVPIVGEGTLKDMINIIKKGFKSKWGDFTAEGIVARPKVELVDRRGNRIITKLKYKDFLK